MGNIVSFNREMDINIYIESGSQLHKCLMINMDHYNINRILKIKSVYGR